MDSIENRKYWIGIYVGLAIFSSILIVLLILFLLDFFLPVGDIIMPIVLIIYAIFIFLLYREALYTQKITILKNGIILTRKNERKEIKWSEISNIDYDGRNGFLRMVTIKIKTKSSGNPVLIYHSHYANSNILTEAIKYCFNSYKLGNDIDLKLFTPIKIAPVSKNKIQHEQFDYVSRIPFTNFRNLFLLVGFFGIYKMITAEYVPMIGIIMGSIIAALSFLAGILGMGKIGISDNYLVIKYYYFPIQTIFRLKDIQQVYIESPGDKSPNAIRIITNDSKQKTIPIANFLKKDWGKLGNLLTKREICVNNTLIR
jgi:hypothetical protein